MNPICIARGPSFRSESHRLVRMLRDSGYAYVSHPSLTKDRLSEIREAGRRVLTVPANVRAPLQTATGFRGYYTYRGASGTRDPIECFSIGRELESEVATANLRRPYYDASGWSAEEVAASTMSRRNMWCEEVADANAVLLRYFDLCGAEIVPSLIDMIVSGVTCELSDSGYSSLPVTWRDEAQMIGSDFTVGHSNMDFNLEAKLYPAVISGDKPHTSAVRGAKVLRGRVQTVTASRTDVKDTPVERLSTHADLSSVTLLMQDCMGGLEVLDTATETFVEVPVLDSALLVNAGEFMAKWSSGLVPATPHRVRNTTADAQSRARCSIVLFAFPNFDYRITPLLGGVPFFAGDMHPLP